MDNSDQQTAKADRPSREKGNTNDFCLSHYKAFSLSVITLSSNITIHLRASVIKSVKTMSIICRIIRYKIIFCLKKYFFIKSIFKTTRCIAKRKLGSIYSTFFHLC